MRKRTSPDRIVSILRDDPRRPRRRIERQPGLPQARHQPHYLLPLEGPFRRTPYRMNNSACVNSKPRTAASRSLVAELALDRRMLQEALKKKP